ncbi:ECF transporter S component [Luteipulveratus sp. YIM 133132]|uniref:ECF transporter S component n=1 Tax=Luteipulveratus flavus TaxID=3031728 RepID=UPI0023AF89CA|nr:ECF transporter S component [Luteipulveratus sp. YIM 133132]MDE9366433.1 ECF transporter S component [Luteipulveratus sp. YIM 133132]
MTPTPEIVRWRWTSTIAMTLVTLVGVLSFTWPFLVDSRSALTGDHSTPWLFPVLVGLLGCVLLAELSRGGLDAKVVATLGVLAAMGGALRVLSAGTAGLEPMFFLVVLGGRVLGRTAGFLLGALAIVTGAFLTGGVGPWTPFQMLATGWVGLGAALLPRVGERAERWLLAAYGLLTGLLYGAVMNLWFWPFLGSSAPAGAGFDAGDPLGTQLAHYGVFYGLTSLGWDLPRGVLTAVLVLVAARPVLLALRRAVRRASFGTVPAPGDAPRGPRQDAGRGLQ